MGDLERFMTAAAVIAATVSVVVGGNIAVNKGAVPAPSGVRIVSDSIQPHAPIRDTIYVKIPDEFTDGTDFGCEQAVKFVWREMQMKGAAWAVIVNEGWIPMRREIHIEEVEDIIAAIEEENSYDER